MNVTAQKYSDCIDHLKTVRLQYAEALINLEKRAINLAYAKAKAEQNIVDQIGNGKAKAVGSNADDRARVLTVHIEENENYKVARENHLRAQHDVYRLKAEKDSLEDKAKSISIESDAYLRDALREFATALTQLLSGRLAEAAVGNNNIDRIGGIV